MKTHQIAKRTGGGELRKHEERPFEGLYRGMNRLFDGFFDEFDLAEAFPAAAGLAQSQFQPKFELTESESEVDLRAELPGMEEKDIEVSLDGDIMTVSGEKRQEKEGKERNCHYSEISYGAFSRSFMLPQGVDSSKAKAKFSKGVLRVSLPKTEEAKKRQRRIEIATD